jgi:hypothetical protein
MAIITKKIGKKEYSYLVTREGKRVVHHYLGSARNTKALKMAKVKDETTCVPMRLRTLFWDTALENISLKSHARYVIDRVLESGDLDAFTWLRNVYPGWKIQEELILSRSISVKSRNFWQIWFGVEDA